MKPYTSIALILTCILVLTFEAGVTQGDIFDFFADIERGVRKGIVKPVEKLLQNVVERPVREIFQALGLRRVRKTYREFKQEATHARVIFTENSYRVEKVTPCKDGRHDIVKAEQPTKIRFEDQVVILQDRYCRKCGEHFYTEPKTEL